MSTTSTPTTTTTAIDTSAVTHVVNGITFDIFPVVEWFRAQIGIQRWGEVFRIRRGWVEFCEDMDRPIFRGRNDNSDYVGFASAEEAESYAAPRREARRARRAEREMERQARIDAEASAAERAYARNRTAIETSTVVSTAAGQMHIFDYTNDFGSVMTMVARIEQGNPFDGNGWTIYTNTGSSMGGALSSNSAVRGETLEAAWGAACR